LATSGDRNLAVDTGSSWCRTKLSTMLTDITGMQLTCLRLAQLQQQGQVRL
jgi:hypothetical protein